MQESSHSNSTASTETALFQRLCELNENWSSRTPDFSVLTDGSIDDNVSLIQTHLRLVIDQLETADVQQLTPDQLDQRLSNIQRLKTYMTDGKFPQNVYVPGLRPVFIDLSGTHCAVGHLIATSGNPQLANTINQEHQLDVIRNIETEGLSEWQLASGLSLDELALIQPQYEFEKLPSDTLHYPGEIEDLICGDSTAIISAIQCDPSLLKARCGGKTLLHFAAAAGDLELVKLLVANGADINAVSNSGCDKAELAKGGRHSIFRVQWNESTRVTQVHYRGFGGRVFQHVSGAYVANVLQDIFGGIAEKNALFYATVEPGKAGRGIYQLGLGYGQDRANLIEQLQKDRASVAKWLKEQGLKGAYEQKVESL